MERHYGWVIVAAGAVITCLAMGAMFALPVYLQPMSDETGWSRAGISGAMTVGFIVMGVAGFAWGTLTDRIGARPVILTAAVILGLGLFIASRTDNLLIFQIAYGGLVGAAGGAFFAPLIATTLGWFDKNRSLAVSLVTLGAGVAPMTMTPLASILIEAIGWRQSMAVIGLTAVAIIFPLGFLIRSAPQLQPQPTSSDIAPAAKEPSRIGEIFRTPQFIILAGVFFLCCAAHSGPIFHTVSYAILCGATPLAAATIYSVEGLAGLGGRVLFGLLGDKFGVRRVIVGGLALQSVGIYCYIYVTELQHFYMLALVLGLVYGGVMPLYSVLARDYFGPKVMGTVLGGITMTSSIGMAFGPVGGGYLYDTYGTYHWLYIASAAVGLGGALLALAFPPKSTSDNIASPQPA